MHEILSFHSCPQGFENSNREIDECSWSYLSRLSRLSTAMYYCKSFPPAPFAYTCDAQGNSLSLIHLPGKQ